MKEFDKLIQIVEQLTGQNGCPWDKAQTHQSIRINLIEEAYEAVDAINRQHRDDMIEELGDVLLQAVFNADIAKRNGDFCLVDVINRLCKKLIDRHTHIFLDQIANDENQALNNWESQKAKEKQYSSVKCQLQAQPQIFPALLYAQKIIKKSDFEPDKQRLLDLIANYSSSNSKSIGEILFLVSALATKQNLSPEVELDNYNKNYVKCLK